MLITSRVKEIFRRVEESVGRIIDNHPSLWTFSKKLSTEDLTISLSGVGTAGSSGPSPGFPVGFALQVRNLTHPGDWYDLLHLVREWDIASKDDGEDLLGVSEREYLAARLVWGTLLTREFDKRMGMDETHHPSMAERPGLNGGHPPNRFPTPGPKSS